MAKKDIPISVTKVMAEYDKKASSYGKGTPIKINDKEKLKWSTFSNNDELNACNKRTSCEKKVGDQSNIVDYINFYPVSDNNDKKSKLSSTLLGKKKLSNPTMKVISTYQDKIQCEFVQDDIKNLEKKYEDNNLNSGGIKDLIGDEIYECALELGFGIDTIFKFKDMNISNKKKAMSLLKSESSANILFFIYCYALTDELKIDEEIYCYLKDKLLFKDEELLEFHSCEFLSDYGRACGRINDKDKINCALKKVENFIKENNLYYAYWLFWGLIHDTYVDFETYLSIYKLFEENVDMQGNLLWTYSQQNKENIKNNEMIRLLEESSEESVRVNWHKAFEENYFSNELYNLLLRKNVSKELLDEMYVSYFNNEKRRIRQEIKILEHQGKSLRKEKRKQWWNKLKY